VPDPIAPALRQQFDDSITAIQRAAEAAGYILDRLDLPWPTSNAAHPADELANEFEIRLKEESSSSSETPASAALSARKRAEAPPRASKGRNGTAKVLPRYFIATRGDAVGANRFESDPGLMLFRSTSETKPELLVVFLVGEVPTSGIHPKAMRSALDQTSWLCEWKKGANDPAAEEVFKVAACKTSERELELLAPTYSGSARSLDLILLSWLDSLPHSGDHSEVVPPKVNIISGTATAVPSKFKVDWHFRSVMIPVDDLLHEALHHLAVDKPLFLKRAIQGLGDRATHMVRAQNGRVAILAEADTLYGQSIQPTAIPTSTGTPTSNPASGCTNGSASPSSAKGSPPTSAATQTSNPSSEK
jgi:hypothetical protein